MNALVVVRKDIARFWVLSVTYLLAVTITTILRSTLRIGTWSDETVFRINNNPFWLFAAFAELCLIGIIVPAVVQEDHLRRATSFFLGRPVSYAGLALAKLLFLVTLGSVVPAVAEAFFLIGVGLKGDVVTTCVIEVLLFRTGAISLFVWLAARSKNFGRYLFRAAAAGYLLMLLQHGELGMIGAFFGACILLAIITEPFVWALFPMTDAQNQARGTAVPLALSLLLGFLWITVIVWDGSTSRTEVAEFSDQVDRLVLTVLPHDQSRWAVQAITSQIVREDTLLDLHSIHFGGYSGFRLWRDEPANACMNEDFALSLMRRAGIQATQSGWIRNCAQRLYEGSGRSLQMFMAGKESRSEKGEAWLARYRGELDYRLPFRVGSSIDLPGRRISVVKEMTGSNHVGSLVEYAVSPLLTPDLKTPKVRRNWAMDEETPRYYFLLNPKTGEVMQLGTFHLPLEGMEGPCSLRATLGTGRFASTHSIRNRVRCLLPNGLTKVKSS